MISDYKKSLWVSMTTTKYRRIVLKLSAEALSGEQGYRIEAIVIRCIAKRFREVAEVGDEDGVVVDFELIWRGIFLHVMGMIIAYADYIFMQFLLIQSLAFLHSLEPL